jgi:hypothetical protein
LAGEVGKIEIQRRSRLPSPQTPERGEGNRSFQFFHSFRDALIVHDRRETAEKLALKTRTVSLDK